MSDPFEAAKRAAGRRAADLVESGMRIGLGSGSTFLHALERLGERVRDDGLRVAGVPTSEATADRARELGVPLLTLDDVDELDLAIDGADEIDREKHMIKGGGGALLREKIVAAAAREMLVVVGDNKLVAHLGETFALPVEVIAFGWRQVARAITALGGEPQRRTTDRGVYRTDNGNYVLDCRFAPIERPAELERELDRIPGVIETGLFIGMAGRVFVGTQSGEVRVE